MIRTQAGNQIEGDEMVIMYAHVELDYSRSVSSRGTGTACMWRGVKVGRRRGWCRQDLKELKLRPGTDQHDYQVRLKAAQKFISKVCSHKCDLPRLSIKALITIRECLDAHVATGVVTPKGVLPSPDLFAFRTCMCLHVSD